MNEIGVTAAGQLIDPLIQGLFLLDSQPELFRHFEPVNGWGSFEGFVMFVENYLDECIKHPTAKVQVCR